jgi:hypothetical protein
MLRELICREVGVRLSEVSVGRLLGKLGLSPQRPLYRAYQQNPEAVARWKAETTPRSAPRRRQRAARSTSPTRPGCARTITRGPPGAGRQDAGGGGHRGPLCGQADLGGERQGGAVVCRRRGQPERGGVPGLCRRLLADATGPVFLVLDGHLVHRSNAVKQFAAASGGRLRLCFLPG